MSAIPPVGETWLVMLECKQTGSFLNGVTQPLPGMPAVTLSDPSVSGAKWAMTSINQITVSLRCMGTLEGPRFLNGLTVEGRVALAPVTSGVFSGTHWSAAPAQGDPTAIELNCAGAALGATVLAEINGGVALAARFAPAPPNALWIVRPLGLLVVLQCMGTAPGPVHRFLNGRTRDNPPTVDLQDLTSGPNTGTLWLIARADDGNFTLSCQGALGGPSFLRGRTDDDTVGLVDSPDGLSGTKWFRANHPVDSRYFSIQTATAPTRFLNGTTFSGSVDLASRADGIFTGTMWRETSPSIWWEPCPLFRPSHANAAGGNGRDPARGRAQSLGPPVVRSVERLAQLTGFRDPVPGAPFIDSATKWGVLGTDLGCNCKDPEGNLFFFFGDVIPNPQLLHTPTFPHLPVGLRPGPIPDRDSHFVAFIAAGSALTSLTAVMQPLTGYFDPIHVAGDIGVTHTFEVASGAFWWNDKVHVFMHVNADTRKAHPEQQNKPPQGCYLVSKTNPAKPGFFQFEFAFSPRRSPPPDYTALSTNSSPPEKFGGVAPVIVQNGGHSWLPSDIGQGLVMFGIGFNKDVGDLATHLAWMPLVEGQDPSPDTVRYCVGIEEGQDGERKPKWSADGSADSQDNAIALFGPERNMQSISAMWDEGARGWLIMHMTADNTVNIVDPVIARIGATPLAMSDSFAVFDPCREQAYAKYMHWPGLDDIHNQCDPATLPDGPAWAYGAFLLDGRSKIDLIRGNLDLHYVLSLSSPYQVQLMHTALQVGLPGPLLFVNAQTGDGKTAIVDSTGAFTDKVQTLSGFGNWTHVVGTPGGGVLFYSASDGTAATAVVNSNGEYSFIKKLDPLLKGWTHITSVGRHGLFFYKFDTAADTGTAKTALLDGAGNFTLGNDISGFGQWTHVVGCLNGAMLFYNRLRGGIGATATVDASGQYTFVGTIDEHDIDAGWSHIVAVGAGNLFFYNVDTLTGDGATASIDGFSGMFARGQNNLTNLGQWTLVVGLRNGSVFFYKLDDGDDPALGATATIDQDGHYVAQKNWSFSSSSPSWRLITAA